MKTASLGSLLLLCLTASVASAQPAAQSLIDLQPEPLLPGAPDANNSLHRPDSLLESEEEARVPARLWFHGEYLLWWIKDSNIPPLLTTGSPADPLPGALGQPHTTILFGGGNVDNYTRSGGRF